MELGRRIASALDDGDLRADRAASGSPTPSEPPAHRAFHPRARPRRRLGAGDARHRGGGGAEPPAAAEPRAAAHARASRAPSSRSTAPSARACAQGVVPHLVVSVDPHPRAYRALVRRSRRSRRRRPTTTSAARRWTRPTREDEVAANRELVELVDGYGAATEGGRRDLGGAGRRRPLRAGRDGALLVEPDVRRLRQARQRLAPPACETNGLPCLNGGGNVGTAAWVLAHAVLGKRRDRPGRHGSRLCARHALRADAVLPRAAARCSATRLAEAFIHIDNPITGETWFSDPAYYWFREVFLEMARDAECETFNCTEGGILFGPGVTR